MSITNGTTTPMKVNKNRTSPSSFGNNFLTRYQSIDTVTIAKNNATKRWARPQLDKQLANPRRTAVGFATFAAIRRALGHHTSDLRRQGRRPILRQTRAAGSG